jgi:hypothetical protein
MLSVIMLLKTSSNSKDHNDADNHAFKNHFEIQSFLQLC